VSRPAVHDGHPHDCLCALESRRCRCRKRRADQRECGEGIALHQFGTEAQDAITGAAQALVPPHVGAATALMAGPVDFDDEPLRRREEVGDATDARDRDFATKANAELGAAQVEPESARGIRRVGPHVASAEREKGCELSGA